MKHVITTPTNSDVSVQQMVGRLAKQASMPGNAVDLHADPIVAPGESQKVGRALRKSQPFTINHYSLTK